MRAEGKGCAPAESNRNVFSANADLLCCPACRGALELDTDFACRACGQRFGWHEGIALFFCPNQWTGKPDVTSVQRAFYEDSPFPNYDDADSVATLADKARSGIFAQLLDDQVPVSAAILEVGCGTAQLSNFLASSSRARTVFGADLSLTSLGLGEEFRRRHRIDNLGLCQMNLFRPAFKPRSFDLVISNGVLHHTSDPRRAFGTIAELVRPGGYIAIGLYNSFARLPTGVRRIVFRTMGDRFAFLDRRLRRGAGLNEGRWRAWFRDQYKNPHESKHSMGEVLRWFDHAGIDFISSIPRVDGKAVDAGERLFDPHPRGSAADRLMVQLRMLLAGGADGGLFVMIGRVRG